jgi:hypothetical protein
MNAMTDHERGVLLAYIAGLAPGVFDDALDHSPSVDAAELAARQR